MATVDILHLLFAVAGAAVGWWIRHQQPAGPISPAPGPLGPASPGHPSLLDQELAEILTAVQAILGQKRQLAAVAKLTDLVNPSPSPPPSK